MGRPSMWKLSLAASIPAVAVGIFITSPRWSLGGPSLTDDWYAISQAPGQVHDVWALLSVDGQRFRPGWVVWSYVQWHTFGSPDSVLGADVWNVVRLGVLVGGLVGVMALAVGVSGLRALVPIALPALLVVSIPAFGVDVARFGPQEPLLVGGMLLGGSLLFVAGRDLTRVRQEVRPWRVAGLIAAGYPLWVLGVYQKESSLCVIVLVAAVAFGYRNSIRSTARKLSRRRLLGIATLAGMAALPLAHVTVETAVILQRGDLIYGTEVDAGGGFGQLRWYFERMNDVLGTPLGWVLLVASLSVIGVSLVRRRPHWIAIGLVGTALAALAWSAQTGVVVSRYYIPTIALLAVVTGMGLVMLPPLLRVVAVAMLAFEIVTSSLNAHDRVGHWAAIERNGVDFVATVARLQATGCPVETTALAEEPAEALPVLVGLRRPEPGTCASSDGYLVTGNYSASPQGAKPCELVGSWALDSGPVEIRRCPRAS